MLLSALSYIQIFFSFTFQNTFNPYLNFSTSSSSSSSGSSSMIKGASIAAEASQYKDIYFENKLTLQNERRKILYWMVANISRPSTSFNFLHCHNAFLICYVPPKYLNVVTLSEVVSP